MAAKRFEDKGGRLVRGWGRLEGPKRVVVGDRVIEAERAVVVNIGTRAWIPAGGRSGRHPVLDQPRGHRERGGAGLAGRPGRWRHRCRAGPGVPPLRSEVTVLEAGRRWSGRRSPRPGACWPRCSGPRASTSAPGWRSSRYTTTATASPYRSAPGSRSWRPAAGGHRPAGPTWPSSMRPRSGSTSRPGRSRSTTTCGWPASTGCGRWATSTGKGPSPTSRCTRPTSWSTTSWASWWSRPTTGPCPGSPSPTPRSGRWA